MSEDKISYPCISEKAWWLLRNQFKKSIPSEITDVYIKTLLEMTSVSSARSNILVPLRQIGFVDENGKPSDLLYDYRLDDKYSEVCDKLLKSVYPSELLDLFPDDDVDKGKASNYFMSKVRAGAGQAGKLAAFFALLKSKRIGEIAKSSSKNEKNTRQTSQKFKTEKHSSSPDLQNENLSLPTPKSNKNMAVHIDLQIHISPEADAEQIDHIFASMSKHLYKE